MKVSGLTGGIGTGKTTVARMFESLGAVIVDSDSYAHDCLSKDSNGYKQVVGRYGESVLDAKHEIDREKIAGIVFKDPKEKQWLEQLIHPCVFDRIQQTITRFAEKDGIMIIEVPLLFETGAEQWLRPVIVVTCSEETQIQRIRHRTPGMDDGHILDRVRAQMPTEEKVKKADFVIDNSGSREQTSEQVKKIWASLSMYYEAEKRGSYGPIN